MEWLIVLMLAIGTVLVLMFVGLPVAFSFLTVNIVGLYWIGGAKALSMLTNSIIDSATNVSMAPLPLFVLMGEVLFLSKSVEVIFDAVDKWAGGIRARLNIVTLVVATIFGAISGLAMGVAAMLGSSLLPEMKNRKYDSELSIGCILAGACLAPIIPPTMLGILVAVQANVSVADLLIAGIIPGLILAGLALMYVFIRVWMNPNLAPAYEVSTVSLGEKLIALVRCLPFLAIIFAVIGFMMFGIASPTESAATGAIAAMIVSAGYKKLNFEIMKKAVLNTMKISGMLLLIVAGSKAFAQILAMTGAIQGLVEIIEVLDVPPMMLYTIMLLIILVLGCFIDQISIILIAIPIYLPVVAILNFEPVWFWINFLILLTIGGITPPFGLVLFSLKGAAPDISIWQIYRAAFPIVILYLIGVILFSIFPNLVLWLV